MKSKKNDHAKTGDHDDIRSKEFPINSMEFARRDDLDKKFSHNSINQVPLTSN
jgi:hypothetical protein